MLRRIKGARGRTLSATMGPLVALVSAAITTPPSNMHPTIVVPVLVALGRGTPCACSARLRLWLEKSKPGMLARVVQPKLTDSLGGDVVSIQTRVRLS